MEMREPLPPPDGELPVDVEVGAGASPVGVLVGVALAGFFNEHIGAANASGNIAKKERLVESFIVKCLSLKVK